MLLTHIGYENDLSLLAELDGVDIIVGGDSHSLLGEGPVTLVGNPVAPYPTMVGNTCVVQAWEYAHGFGMLDVSFDDGVVTSCEGSIKIPYSPTSIADSVSAGDASAISDYLVATKMFYPVEADTGAATTLSDFKSKVDALKESIIATVSTRGICFERI